MADVELLIQALTNLVDNAVKYSYAHTSVVVFADRLRNGGRFFIGVRNKGIPIRPGQEADVRKRRFRGEEASLVVGEGSGLGLWIVDQIMIAHGGELQVIPTREEDGITEIRLVFPVA